MEKNSNIQLSILNSKENKKSSKIKNRKRWTKTEINYLRVNYKRSTAKKIAEKLNRPIQAVYSKVKSEGLTKAAPYNYKNKKVTTPVSKAEIEGKKEVVSKKSVKSIAKSNTNNNGLINYLLLMNSASLLIASAVIILAILH